MESTLRYKARCAQEFWCRTDSITQISQENWAESQTDVGLSKDTLLSTIRETFYEHVFARKTNPNDLISYEFTQQKKIVKPKVKPILKNGESSASSEKKSQLVK